MRRAAACDSSASTFCVIEKFSLRMCRKSLRQIVTISSGSVAMTVAERGSLSNSAISPKKSPGAEHREDDLLPLGRDHRHLHLPFADQVEDVAALVGVEDDVVLRVAARFGDGGDRRELAIVQLREERELPVER